MVIDGNEGFGFGLVPAASDIEGHFGGGFVLGINLTIDLQTAAGQPVPRNLPYSLSYTSPQDGSPVVLQVLHDPAVTYQELLPEGVAITLDIPASARFFALSQVVTIGPNAQVILRPRLQFLESYARITQLYFL